MSDEDITCWDVIYVMVCVTQKYLFQKALQNNLLFLLFSSTSLIHIKDSRIISVSLFNCWKNESFTSALLVERNLITHPIIDWIQLLVEKELCFSHRYFETRF